jgi:syntaxin 5
MLLLVFVQIDSAFCNRFCFVNSDSMLDRTTEFNSMMGVSVPSFEDPSSSATNSMAGSISNAIQNSQQKLNELAKLAKSKSLFNDQTSKINQGTLIIKKEIDGIEKQIQDFEGHLVRNRANSKNTEIMISTLRRRISDLTMHLKEVLEIRAKTLQEMELRKGKFTAQQVGASNFDLEALEGGKGAQERTSMLTDRQDSRYYSARATAAKQVNSMIQELGTMFQKMSHLIAQQEEQVLRIDQDMDSSVQHMNEGHNQLLKYFDRVSGQRGTILKVFGVLIVFVILKALIF